MKLYCCNLPGATFGKGSTVPLRYARECCLTYLWFARLSKWKCPNSWSIYWFLCRKSWSISKLTLKVSCIRPSLLCQGLYLRKFSEFDRVMGRNCQYRHQESRRHRTFKSLLISTDYFRFRMKNHWYFRWLRWGTVREYFLYPNFQKLPAWLF